MLTEFPGQALQPEDVRLLRDVFKRIKVENMLPPSVDIERAFARYLTEMYVRGLVIEEKLYEFGIVAARARFQEPDQNFSHSPHQLLLRQVVIIEDDHFIAMGMKQVFQDAGAIVADPVRSAEQALELLASDVPDLAIVDLNLGDGPSFEVAQHVLDHGLPLCIVSGYARSDFPSLPRELNIVPWLTKPASTERLLQLAATALA